MVEDWLFWIMVFLGLQDLLLFFIFLVLEDLAKNIIEDWPYYEDDRGDC